MGKASNFTRKIPHGCEELLDPDSIDFLSPYPIDCPVIYNIELCASNNHGPCFHCGKYGHRKADCTELAVSELSCKECGKTGYRTEDCWNRKENADKRPSRCKYRDRFRFRFDSGFVRAVCWNPSTEQIWYEVEHNNESSGEVLRRALVSKPNLYFGINIPVQVEIEDRKHDGKIISCGPLRHENGKNRMMYNVSFSLEDNRHEVEGGIAMEQIKFQQRMRTHAKIKVEDSDSSEVSRSDEIETAMAADQSSLEPDETTPSLLDETPQPMKATRLEVESSDGQVHTAIKTSTPNSTDDALLKEREKRKGVSFNKKGGKFSTNITFNNLRYYGGSYELAADAAFVYDEFKRELKIPCKYPNFATKEDYANARIYELENRELGLDAMRDLETAVRKAKSKVAKEIAKKEKLENSSKIEQNDGTGIEAPLQVSDTVCTMDAGVEAPNSKIANKNAKKKRPEKSPKRKRGDSIGDGELSGERLLSSLITKTQTEQTDKLNRPEKSTKRKHGDSIGNEAQTGERLLLSLNAKKQAEPTKKMNGAIDRIPRKPNSSHGSNDTCGYDTICVTTTTVSTEKEMKYYTLTRNTPENAREEKMQR